MYGQDTDLHRRQALRQAEKAIDLDPLDPFCNLNIGRAKWLFDEVEEGLGWMERALQTNPNYAFGFYNSAMLRSVLCDGETAEAQVKEALDLSPLDPHLQSMLGIRTLAALLRGEDDDAVAYAEQTLRAPNPHLYVYMIVAIIFLQAGQMAKAKACLEKIRARNSVFSSKEFLSHYNLRDPEQKAVLVRAVEQLGI
jgi:tetratricopeptide (TPR) repeat protein